MRPRVGVSSTLTLQTRVPLQAKRTLTRWAEAEEGVKVLDMQW